MKHRGVVGACIAGLILLCAPTVRAQPAEGTITEKGIQGFFNLNCPYQASLEKLQAKYINLPAPASAQGEAGSRTLDFLQLGLRLRVDDAGKIREITVLAPEAILSGRPPIPLVTEKKIKVGDSHNYLASQYPDHPKVVGETYYYGAIGFEISAQNHVAAIVLSGSGGGRCGD